MKGLRNLRVPPELLRLRLQGRGKPTWDDPTGLPSWAGAGVPSASRLQIVRERVLANARGTNRALVD